MKVRVDFRKMPEYTKPENYEYRRMVREDPGGLQDPDEDAYHLGIDGSPWGRDVSDDDALTEKGGWGFDI